MIPVNDDPLPAGRQALLRKIQLAVGLLLAFLLLPVGLTHGLLGTPILVALAIDACWLLFLAAITLRRGSDAEGLGWAGIIAMFTATPATLVIALLYGVVASW